MHTAIYARVSTEEQANEGFSIHAQKDKLTKYAELNDWVITDYYVDDGISGKNLTERPEVTRLIEDVKSGKINNVLVYKLDRLTRSVKDLIYLIELFDKHNCTFNSQTEKIDTSNAVGRMFVKIIGIFAEFERENLAERVTFGYEQKTKEGNYTNTNGVFGYDYIVGKGILEVNVLESYYVKKIYEWYLQGDSMIKIANRLRDENVPTKRGGRWNQSTINSILNNPLYIGKVRYGINKKNGFEVIGKNIVSLIENDMFYNVQSLMEKRKKHHSKKCSSDDTYYFKALTCSQCGSKFHAKQQVQNGKKYITYSCNGHYNNSCDAPGFSHYKLENAFLEYLDNIKDFKFNKDVLKNDDKSNMDEANRIKQEISKLNRKKMESTELFSINGIDYETFKNINYVVGLKIGELNRQLDLLNKGNDSNNDDWELIKNVIVNLKGNFIKLTNHEKKMFLERFVKEIKVKKLDNGVVIEAVEF